MENQESSVDGEAGAVEITPDENVEDAEDSDTSDPTILESGGVLMR